MADLDFTMEDLAPLSASTELEEARGRTISSIEEMNGKIAKLEVLLARSQQLLHEYRMIHRAHTCALNILEDKHEPDQPPVVEDDQ